MFGKAKVQAVERLAAEMGLDLERSYAYGDGANDRWFLSAVGRPIAVNPSRGLARIAHTSGWPVEMWREEGTELTQRAQRAHSSQRRAIGATGVLE
jgi:putative phosphoserine phosphatase/1-acylglycerol-3-phosphate O-acyltransferase